MPKQNLTLTGKKTLFQAALARAKKIAGGGIFVITNKSGAASAADQVRGDKKCAFVIEPFGRNTAPAVGLVSLFSDRNSSDAVVVVIPSDHVIADENRFYRVINTAVAEADKTDSIILLGIRPHSASSAYGYIGVKERLGRVSSARSHEVTNFIEKPGRAKAARIISSGRYFWNSGIFIFKASAMLSVLKRRMPVLYKGLRALPSHKDKTRFKNALKVLYGKIRARSLDYAVLEKDEDIRVIPADIAWNDVGSFDSVAGLTRKDRHGNSLFGKHVGLESEDNVIFAGKDCLVGTIGVSDIIVVATPDAVLVCDRKKAQDVRKLVEKIGKDRKLRDHL